MLGNPPKCLFRDPEEIWELFVFLPVKVVDLMTIKHR